ncbi:MAG: hypothetical protein V1716_02750 [Candidatus Uhrbacteria bacterium]
MALKKETKDFRTERASARRVCDEVLLAEFGTARHRHNLHDFYCSVIAAISLPPDKRREGSTPDCGPHQYSTRIRKEYHWQQGEESPSCGTWNGFPAKVEIEWYFFADQAYAVHVDIIIDAGSEPLTPGRVCKIVEAPRHLSFYFCYTSDTRENLYLHMHHALPASVLFDCGCKQPHYNESDKRGFRLTADGDQKLIDLLSTLGMTDIQL